MATIDHPGAPRPKAVKLKSKKHRFLDVMRCQIPLTHEDDMTFQNAQGKTIRGPKETDDQGEIIEQPKGFVFE